MEISVLIKQDSGNGFHAWCGEPFSSSAEGATREEAISKLRQILEAKMINVEVVRLTISATPSKPAVWPDDQITRDWLEGIAAAREKANQTPDPWEE
jgi:hypothetical protein